MKQKNIILLIVIAGVALLSSCLKDLEVVPIDDKIKATDEVFDSPEVYLGVLAKCYAGLAVTGQKGPDGNSDIDVLDEGFYSYLRVYFNHQQLPTDETVVGWTDEGLPDFHNQSWTSQNSFVTAMFQRIMYQVTLCNEFIRQAQKAPEEWTDIPLYAAEARFLRALSYWHAIDLFARPPFVTEDNEVSAFFPEQIEREDLFDYIEAELKDIEEILSAPQQVAYGRADKAAAWMLLAKLYLNAEVYVGAGKYSEAITYLNKIIESGYSLHSNYADLFMADNDINGAQNEIIFPIRFDGLRTQTWGGTLYIIASAIGGNMDPVEYGVEGGWGGTRTTKALIDKFTTTPPTSPDDKRYLFFHDGKTLEIEDIHNFNHGYSVVKFTNKVSSGGIGSSAKFPDTDFPMFRLADVYLMYAEAVLRGGAEGRLGYAEGYINALRARAYGNSSGNINQDDLTLDFILDERARELYWECHRRTDLIRFGKFSDTDYMWPWKGGVKDGKSVSSTYDLFPIPAADITANTKLEQNLGY